MSAPTTNKWDEPFPQDFLDRARTFDETDRLLQVAESLQDKCEARERTFYLTTLFGLLWGVFFILLLDVATMPIVKESGLSAALVTTNVLSWVIVSNVVFTLCFRSWRRQSRDRKTVYEIVEMLRELESALAKHHNFTALEQQQLKIRLRRFEIGPGSDAVRRV